MAEQQRPSVGRVVHYVSEGSPVQPDGSQRYPSECRAATVTEVGGWETVATIDGAEEGTRTLKQEYDEHRVSLAVDNPTGRFYREGVEFDAGGEPRVPGRTRLCTGDDHTRGTWHWPART